MRSVSESYGLPLDPAARVASLPVGVRQRIEIVRCLLQRPRLLIMDEPTSVLTPQEAERLFETLRRLAGEGCAVPLYQSPAGRKSASSATRQPCCGMDG